MLHAWSMLMKPTRGLSNNKRAEAKKQAPRSARRSSGALHRSQSSSIGDTSALVDSQASCRLGDMSRGMRRKKAMMACHPPSSSGFIPRLCEPEALCASFCENSSLASISSCVVKYVARTFCLIVPRCAPAFKMSVRRSILGSRQSNLRVARPRLVQLPRR